MHVYVHYSCVTGLHYQKWDAHTQEVVFENGLSIWPLDFFSYIFSFSLFLYCFYLHIWHRQIVSHAVFWLFFSPNAVNFICFIVLWKRMRQKAARKKTVQYHFVRQPKLQQSFLCLSLHSSFRDTKKYSHNSFCQR